MIRYEKRVPVTMYDAHGDAVLVNPPGTEIRGQKGLKISLVPAPHASGLFSTGLSFPLNGVHLGFGERDGISNEMIADTAHISFETGRLLLYSQRSLPQSQ